MRPRTRRTGAAGLGALAVLAVAAGAADPMDTMLLPGDRLTLEIGSQDVRTVSVAGLDGMRLSATAAAQRGSTLRPELALATPDGVPVDLGRRLKLSKRTARVRGARLDADGPWRLTLTGLSGGGPVALSVAAKVPQRHRFTGELEDAVVSHALPALPGSTIQLKITPKGSPAWTPVVDVVAPSGAATAVPLAARAKGATATIFADELGEHVLRVSGGPGRYTLRATVRAPRVKGRLIAYRDVEARPRIDAFAPATFRNDEQTDVTVTGVGLSTSQLVTVSTPARGYAQAAITRVTGRDATARLDLTGVPPGTLRLGVTTSSGNPVYAADPLTVTNRAPAVSRFSAPEFPSYAPLPLRLDGAGMDVDCEVTIARSSDRLPCAAVITARESHTRIDLAVWPDAYAVGHYDVTVRDPSGQAQTYERALDVLGIRGPPGAVRADSDPGVWGNLVVYDVAYDADHDRILVACVVDTKAEFVLFDLATRTVVDTYRVDVAGTQYQFPRVDWSAADGAFAICWVARRGTTSEGWVRICPDTDLDTQRSLTRVASASLVLQVDPAADSVNGGFVVAWQQYTAATGSQVRAQRFGSDGVPDATTLGTLYSQPEGISYTTSIVHRGNGTFVVAHVGANNSLTAFAIRRILIDDRAQVLQGSLTVAASAQWDGLYQPEMAANPNDHSVILGFTYRDGGILHPAFTRLSGVGVSPGTTIAADGEGILPEGILDRLVWNPERGEFVAGLSRLSDSRVVVRRIRPDGQVKIAYVDESYDGDFGIPWSGPDAGELGLVRVDDVVEDGWTDIARGTERISAAPIR